MEHEGRETQQEDPEMRAMRERIEVLEKEVDQTSQRKKNINLVNDKVQVWAGRVLKKLCSQMNYPQENQK